MKHKTSSQSPPQTFHTVRGTWEQEQAWTLRDFFPESCGLSAAIHIPEASRLVYDCLLLQEHRGEHAVGILSYHQERFHTFKRLGSPREQLLAKVDFSSIVPGSIAFGHNRYATQGAYQDPTNIQPLLFQSTRYGPLAIAHNGTLVDVKQTRTQLANEGVLFQSTMDTELFGHWIARSHAETLEEAIVFATQKIPAAYSFLLCSHDKLIALRDRYGVRPLSFAKLQNGFLVSSENQALDPYPQVQEVIDLEPGEMVVFDLKEPRYQRIQYAPADEHFCIFEGMYFSDPRSRYRNIWHEDFRNALGHKLFEENPHLQGDCIIPVLASGKHAAIGLSEATGIPYREHFKQQHFAPRSNRRSFTSPTREARVQTAYQKLHLRKERVRGKHVIIVDDSIVRSTTIRIINQRLREAGAASITNCISAPPISNICPYGMDFQEKKQLIAAHESIEEIRNIIGADQLIYLSLLGLQEVIDATYRCGTCTGCFGGRYPHPLK